MLINIEDYDHNEKCALRHLSNRAIEAFSPVTFKHLNYPCQVYEETELIRYVDVMHETKRAKYYSPPYKYSMDEARLIADVCDKVAALTADRFGRPIRPRMAPLAAITLFRAISALQDSQAKKPLSIFEIGPGSGYLGAFLIDLGYRYGSMDNTQAFYLWQNRLWNYLAPDEFTEMATGAVPESEKRVIHVPWWVYSTFHQNCPLIADIIVCDHVLGEVSRFSLKYILRISREMLKSSSIGSFIFTSPGKTQISTMIEILCEFKDVGFVRIPTSGFIRMALNGPEPSKFAEKRVGRTIVGRAKRKISRLFLSSKDLSRQPTRVEESNPFYNPSKQTNMLTAYDFMKLSSEESPMDYDLIKFIGGKVPENQDTQ